MIVYNIVEAIDPMFTKANLLAQSAEDIQQ